MENLISPKIVKNMQDLSDIIASVSDNESNYITSFKYKANSVRSGMSNLNQVIIAGYNLLGIVLKISTIKEGIKITIEQRKSINNAMKQVQYKLNELSKTKVSNAEAAANLSRAINAAQNNLAKLSRKLVEVNNKLGELKNELEELRSKLNREHDNAMML